MIVRLVPSILSLPVLVELQQADLITGEECRGMRHPRYVVEVQSGKSPAVQTKTADVLKRHGFEEESKLLAGKQTLPIIHVPVGCCTVEPSCKGHLKAYITVVSLLYLSCTQCWVIMSEYQNHTAFPLGQLKDLLAHTKPFPWVVVCQQWSEWSELVK